MYQTDTLRTLVSVRFISVCTCSFKRENEKNSLVVTVTVSHSRLIFSGKLMIVHNKLTDVRNFNSADNFLLSLGKPSIVFLKLSHLFKSSVAFSTLWDSNFSGQTSYSLSAMFDNGLVTGHQLPGLRKREGKILLHKCEARYQCRDISVITRIPRTTSTRDLKLFNKRKLKRNAGGLLNKEFIIISFWTNRLSIHLTIELTISSN